MSVANEIIKSTPSWQTTWAFFSKMPGRVYQHSQRMKLHDAKVTVKRWRWNDAVLLYRAPFFSMPVLVPMFPHYASGTTGSCLAGAYRTAADLCARGKWQQKRWDMLGDRCAISWNPLSNDMMHHGLKHQSIKVNAKLRLVYLYSNKLCMAGRTRHLICAKVLFPLPL